MYFASIATKFDLYQFTNMFEAIKTLHICTFHNNTLCQYRRNRVDIDSPLSTIVVKDVLDIVL